MALDFTKIYWHQFSNDSKDNIDVAGSVIVEPNEFLTLSSGFLSTDREYYYELNSIFDINDKLYGLFFWGSIGIHLYNFDFNFALATSHFSSEEWRKQSIGKFSLGYHL